MMSVYSLARPATARPSDARACAAPHGGLTSLDERQRKGSAENICREHLDLVANHESKSLRAGRLERAGKGGFIHNCDTEMGGKRPEHHDFLPASLPGRRGTESGAASETRSRRRCSQARDADGYSQPLASGSCSPKEVT